MSKESHVNLGLWNMLLVLNTCSVTLLCNMLNDHLNIFFHLLKGKTAEVR